MKIEERISSQTGCRRREHKLSRTRTRTTTSTKRAVRFAPRRYADTPTRPYGFSARCPKHPPLQDCTHLFHAKLRRYVAQRTKEHLPMPMLSFPDDRHFHSGHPESMFSRKSSGGKHVVIWINVHIILLRPIIEIVQSRGDWVGTIHNIHPVINDISGMRHELAASHKLIMCVVPEAICHAAVKSG